ncbi:SDR family oxidoreductase [Phaeodactylibacter xiamenensis]|uniref:SDR family oxidoreductase n=1 Tax=Phaeodactylibacter xiamenensis TaxID=1524460 RepID=UPI003CCC0AEE
MKVLIIGANGQIGTQLVDKLKDSQHEPVPMVRKEEDVSAFKEKGTNPVLADLEEDIGHAFRGIDAVVFTAGSGADTGEEKTELVDKKGAVKAINEAKSRGIDRFVMVSAFGADFEPEEWPDSMKHYYEAKATADNHLISSGLNYTILKPGRLTNDSGKGKVDIGERTQERMGEIPREDVATTIKEILDRPNTYRGSYEMLQGEQPIKQAVERI